MDFCRNKLHCSKISHHYYIDYARFIKLVLQLSSVLLWEKGKLCSIVGQVNISLMPIENVLGNKSQLSLRPCTLLTNPLCQNPC